MSYQQSPVAEGCVKCQRSVEVTCDNPAPICDICDGIERIVLSMDALRLQRKYAESDKIRDELARIGILVSQGKNGSQWRIK
jgi:cysteinyl-tRNA synthetase